MGISVKFLVEVILLCLGLALLVVYFIMNYNTITKSFFEYLRVLFPS